MKNYVNNAILYTIKTTMVVIFFTSFITSYTQTIILSFDSLYPQTWYQKAMESLISTWQLLEIYKNKPEEEMIFIGDIVLGKITFAQLCIQRMENENNKLLLEDYDYLIYVKGRIRSLLKEIIITEKLGEVATFCEEIL